MREIILDTETTGFKPEEGHRLAEIGALELFNHIPTGIVFHKYLNPERDMPREAEAVHGLSNAFLRDKPLFAAIAGELLEFLGDAPIIIHNASFDMSFINAELATIRHEAISMTRVIDTLALARRKYPMGPNSLDALCKRFGVDNSKRTKHGALLDAELLAEVYLELIGGRQQALTLQAASRTTSDFQGRVQTMKLQRPKPLPPRLSDDENTRHQQLIAKLGAGALWSREKDV
jgi:DNA polymerase III subunit epsilon